MQRPPNNEKKGPARKPRTLKNSIIGRVELRMVETLLPFWLSDETYLMLKKRGLNRLRARRIIDTLLRNGRAQTKLLERYGWIQIVPTQFAHSS